MSEYIDREMIYPLAKKICDAIHSKEYSPVVMPHMILDWVDDLPAANVRPVVPGKWVRTIADDEILGEYWSCDKCGEHSYLASNFCPNCGASMVKQET